MKAVDNPCVPTCRDRSATCHGHCDAYARYVAWREFVRAARLADTDLTRALVTRSRKNARERQRDKKP